MNDQEIQRLVAERDALLAWRADVVAAVNMRPRTDKGNAIVLPADLSALYRAVVEEPGDVRRRLLSAEDDRLIEIVENMAAHEDAQWSMADAMGYDASAIHHRKRCELLTEVVVALKKAHANAAPKEAGNQ